MEISLIKNNGLLIKGKNCTLAIDPLNPKKELTLENDKVNCVLISDALWDMKEAANRSKAKNSENTTDEEVKIFSWPGEFEVKGVGLTAKIQYPEVKADPKKLLFMMNIDGFKLCYLPELSQELHSDLIETIGDLDLLIMPMVKDQKTVSNTLEEIEPKGVLALNLSEDATLQSQFLKNIGRTDTEEKPIIKISTKSDLSGDKMELFLLKAA